MKKLLIVKGSPRGNLSHTWKIADSFLTAYMEKHPDAIVDQIDLWQADLPEFDGDSAAAKVSFFGEPAMNEKQQTVYDELISIFNRFNAADDYLFTVPMWNFGVPYMLKKYIDLLSMPSTLFGFDPSLGYIGLLKNKKATAIYSAAIFMPGVPPAFGLDHTSTYFEGWLRFAGIHDVVGIAHWGTKMKPDQSEEFAKACEEAKKAALR